MSRRKKKRFIEVKSYGPLRKNWLYRGRIRAVSLESAPDRILVEIVHLNCEDLDRVTTASMPMPRPGNRTCRLLEACGFNAAVGTRISLDGLVNRIVGFRLRDSAAGEPEEFDFERIAEPPATEIMPPRAEDSGIERAASNDAAVPLADHEIPF